MRLNNVAAVAIFTLMLVAGRSAQAQIFVNPATGVDVIGGGSASAPLRTIGFAINLPSAPLEIKLRPGFYNEDVVIDRDLSLEGTGPGVRLTPATFNGTAITITDALTTITSATKIKNIEIRNCAVGIRVVGTPGGTGVAPQLSHLKFTLFQQAIDVEIRNGDFNPMSVQFCSASGAVLPTPFTRGLVAKVFDGVLEIIVSACTFSVVETAIDYLGTDGSLISLVENVLINTCERGIAIDGGNGLGGQPTVIVRYTTIADDFLSIGPNTNAIEVAPTASAFVSVENSIFSLIQPNNDPIEAPVNNVFATSTDSNDPADVALHPSNNLIPAGGPGFGGTFPYQLLPTSMSIDTADPASSLPMTGGALPTDRIGSPRFSDGLRTGVLSPDRGAFEFSPVAMDVTLGGTAPAMAFNVTPSHVGVPVSSQFSIVGSSNFASASADLAVVSIDFANNTNVFLAGTLQAMGNLLVAPTSTLVLPLAGTTAGGFHGSVSLTAPGLVFAGFEVDYQVGFFSTDVSVAGPGNLSRRVRVEFNP